MRSAALALLAFLAGGSAGAPAVAQDADEAFGGLPAGDGREDVYDVCRACHSLRIVIQQGLTRDSWEETLIWMVEEQGMEELDKETWALILDYLAAAYGPDRRNVVNPN